MIITHLSGGLGNQLFQYAMGRQVALRLDVDLRFDLFSYRSDKLRKYGLSVFPIHGRPATWAELFRICPLLAMSRLFPRPLYDRGWRHLGRLGIKSQCRDRIGEGRLHGTPLPLRRGVIVAERQMTFDRAAFECRDSSLLVGWWMQEGYFQAIRPALLQELSPSAPPSEWDQSLLRHMDATGSVALHVRRSDKVGRDDFTATSLVYCLRAMAEMKRRLLRPHFYVFSDDPQWTRQHLGSLPDVTLVTQHDWSQAHDVLRLMRACQHQIIAASSLSWWAAWLNDRQGRIVISPPSTHWIRSPGYDTSQILPDDWLVVDAPWD